MNSNWRTKLSIAKTGFISQYNSRLFNDGNDLDNFPQQTSDEKNIFSNQIYRLNQIIKVVPNHRIEIGLNRSVLSTDYKTERRLESSSEQNSLNQNSYLQSVYSQDIWFI